MTNTYVTPTEMLAGEDVYPSDWNRLVINQKALNERLAVVEGLEPPDPDFSSFPLGGVIAFRLAAASIPAGWQICDGTNGTPDMTGLFVYGATGDGDLADTGGTATHTHTNPTTGSSGGHSHSANGNTGSASAATNALSGSTSVASGGHTHSVSLNTNSAGSHAHTVGNTGSGSNLPPNIKLYWITRVS